MGISIKILQKGYIRRFDILIFVTVGTHNQGFDRLIKTVDNLIGKRKIKERVLVQTGYTKYIPKNCESFDFAPYEKFIDICKKSSIVITHGGVGSIMIPLNLEKKTIVVPRLKIFGEHVDDHQLQIVKELEKQGRILPIYDINELEKTIKKAKKWEPREEMKRSKILDIVSDFVLKL